MEPPGDGSCMTSPAFATFTTALMHVARTVDMVIHAADVSDHQMAALVARRLRRHLATLDHALRELDSAKHLEACSLLAGLAERITEREALQELEPCRELLGRFR